MTQQVCIKSHATNTAPVLVVNPNGSVIELPPEHQTGDHALWNGSSSLVISEGERFDFSMALALLRAGRRVARQGWNGKGMWLGLVAADNEPSRANVRYHAYGTPDGIVDENPALFGLRKLPWIGMKTADDGFVPWLASQTDMLATDWEMVR